MDIKLNLPNTKCCDWNDLFSQRYHRMFRISDLDEWGIKEQSIQLIKKQVRNSKDPQSLEIDNTKLVLPDKKTFAIRGLGYWVGSLQWNRKDDSSQNTEISAVISKYWLSAPIAVAGLALGVWYFKDLFSFLKPIGENSMIFLITSIVLVLLTGVANYFVHYFSIKNILKQLTVFLKYKGVSYEFGDDVFDAEKAYAEARQEYEQSLRDAEKSAQAAAVMATETVTSDYVPQTIADRPSTEIMQTQIDEDTYQVEAELIPGNDLDMVTEQFDAAIDSELYATAIAEESATDEFVDAKGNEEATEYFAPVDTTDDSEVELPVVEEITEEFGDGFGDDLDFEVPSIDEEGSDAEIMIENKDMHEPKSEKIKLMADSALQTQDMRMDEFDSEIDGAINVDDSAYALGMDDEFDNADATQIDDFGTEILSPDDAFAQGFSPQVMPEEEFAMDDIVAESDEVEIDNNFEVPEITEEAEEGVFDDADDFDEESDVQIADIVEKPVEVEPEITEEEEQEQLDEYKIEVDEDNGFDDAFDSQFEEAAVTEEVEPEEQVEEASDFAQSFDVDEEALSEISEMTDSFAVPEIAEGFTKSPEDVTEPEIPDDFMVSEITEDMGLTDEEIAEAQGGEESAVFDVPEITEDEDDEEMVIPEDFMVPEIEDEEDDGFADATEYIVQDFADENNETNIESYGDGFQEEEDVDEEEVTPEDMEAIFGKEEEPFGAQEESDQPEEDMGSFDGFDDDAEISEDDIIEPQDEEKISFSDDDFAEPEVQEDSVVDVQAIVEDEDFGDVTEYTEDFVAPEIELEEDDEDEWKDWD